MLERWASCNRKAKTSRSLRALRGNINLEFGISLGTFFLLGFFPLINLMGVALGTVVIAFTTTQIATSVATQQSYNQALRTMATEGSAMLNTGFNGIRDEWWHFTAQNAGLFGPVDMPLEEASRQPGAAPKSSSRTVARD